MKEFYWESKAKKDSVPHILGLTASPVVRSQISALEKLEFTLDAVCRSPTKHREELLAHSQRPSLVSVTFRPRLHISPAEYSESLNKLVGARNRLNILEDPFVVSLMHDKSDRARRQLERALKQKRTYVQDCMKSFCRSVFFFIISFTVQFTFQGCDSSSSRHMSCNCFPLMHAAS